MDVKELLAKHLVNATLGKKFHASRFFNSWFRQEGRAYLFIFTEGADVTNIQFGELVSLLRLHAISSENGDPIENILQFSTHQDMVCILGELIEGFSLEGLQYHEASRIAELYVDLLEVQVIVESRWSSATVYLPPHIDVNLEQICRESGYIYSCGPLVYHRNFDKADSKEFEAALRSYLIRQNKETKKRFAIYSHEEYDTEPRRGISGLRVHLEKFYMGSVSLVELANSIRNNFPKMIVLKHDSYNTKNEEHYPCNNIEVTSTVWLLQDKSLDPSPPSRLSKYYMLCYEQMYVNRNPSHLFDENKLAWIAQTTIPHSLMCSMINIGRRKGGEVLRICDPFVGTGTSLIEAIKLPGVVFSGSDREALCKIMVKDNLSVLSMSRDDILLLIDSVMNEAKINYKIVKNNNIEIILGNTVKSPPIWIRNILKRNNMREQATRSQIRSIENRRIEERVRLYLDMRVAKRHDSAFSRHAETYDIAFRTELITLMCQLLELATQRGLEQKGRNIYLDFYSNAVTIPSERFQEVLNQSIPIKIHDVRELSSRAFDLVVADPPYGYNHEHDTFELAELWSKGVETILDSLSNGGRLVLCLPAAYRSGRHLPVYTTRSIVIQQIIAAANRVGRKIARTIDVVPGKSEAFRAPYYWHSPKVLSREILLFEVFDSDSL